MPMTNEEMDEHDSLIPCSEGYRPLKCREAVPPNAVVFVRADGKWSLHLKDILGVNWLGKKGAALSSLPILKQHTCYFWPFVKEGDYKWVRPSSPGNANFAKTLPLP
jgi:hypothetical protein